MTGELDTDDGRPDLTRIQDEIERRVEEAARSGDPKGLVEALYDSQALDGLIARIHKKWDKLDRADAEDAVAEAVSTLYTAVRKGERVFSPIAFLWKVADRRANDIWRSAKDFAHLESWDMVPAEADNDVATTRDHDMDEERLQDEKRATAVDVARRLVPKLGQQNVQAVIGYMIEAIAAGRHDVPNREIGEALGLSNDTVRTSLSRGLRRLARLAQEEGIVGEGFLEEISQQEHDETYRKGRREQINA